MKSGLIEKTKEKLRFHLHEIIRTKKSAHSIALGFAIGTFISILPTPGFNILLGLLVIFLFKKVNKYSLFGSMAFWNPITLAPIYLLSYKIGDMLFGSTSVIKYNVIILNQIYNFSRRFLVGNFIAALAVSIISYFIVKKIVKLYKMKKSNLK